MRNSHCIYLAFLALAACGGGGGSSSDTVGLSGIPVANYYVSESSGFDGNSGKSSALPFKTITHALSVVASGQSIYVFPGVYSVGTGETFPLKVPASVQLIGSIATDGAGTGLTEIDGGGSFSFPGDTSRGVAVLFSNASHAQMSGFYIMNKAGLSGGDYGIGLVNSDNVIVSENTVRDNDAMGIAIFENSDSNLIANNNLVYNSDAGLYFQNASSSLHSVVENNVIAFNDVGIECNANCGDFGGGAASGTGGNVIACNTTADFWSNVVATFYLENNRWDKDPPTQGATDTFSIVLPSGASAVTTEAGSYVCPPP